MKTAEFYESLEAEITKCLLGLGFSREKGRVSRWRLRLCGGRFFVAFRCNPKNPWQPYSGGSFCTESFFCDDDRLSRQEIETTPASLVDFFAYWPDPDYARLEKLNRNVFRKIQGLDLDSILKDMGLDASARESVRLLLQTALECLQMDVETESGRAIINPNQYYFDRDDVASWGDLLRRMMPAVVAGVREAPNQPFRGLPEK